MVDSNNQPQPTRQYDPFSGEFIAPLRPGGLREQLLDNLAQHQEVALPVESMSRLGRVLTYLGLKDGYNV
jgi:hypothetical protein